MNPFLTNSMPITETNALFFRDGEAQKIKDFVDARNQTVILGVEGVGKTSLLRTVFNKNYRIQKAKEKTLVSRVTEFPSNLKDDDIYNHFIETILSAVNILSSCGENELMTAILNRCESIRTNFKAKEKQFEEIVNEIHDFGFHIVIVVDNFERFTSSKEVTKHHHETLRKMLEKTQYIVSTNYDLNEDSLPQGVSGSLYLMAFAGHEIRIGGWSYEYTKCYIQEQMKNSNIKFSEATISNLYFATGGIPVLVKLAGQYAYEYIESHQSEDDLKFAPVYNEKKVQLLLQHWSKMLTPMQITALRNIQQPSEHQAILRSLYLRGLLEYVQRKDIYGNVITRDDEYLFCCKYFGKYCNDEEKLEAAAQQNPLRAVESVDQTKNELSIDELVEELRKKLDDGAVTKDHLIGITKSLCRYMPDVTGTIDLNEELTDDILSKYLLSKEYLARFDSRVRDFLYVGIQMDRCFENVTRPDFDFSIVYLPFCKAVEMHLNLTIVPMIKKACSSATDHRGRRLSSISDNECLMMGVIYTVLFDKREVGLADKAIDVIKDRCRTRLNNKYPENWWESFQKLLYSIKEKRNDCPHTSMLKDSSGKSLLQELFGSGKKEQAFYPQNAEKSFMMKCLNVHRDFMATYSTNN